VKFLGQDDNRILAIISDHGVEMVDKNLEFDTHFNNNGLKLVRGEAVNIMNTAMDANISELDAYDAHLVINGNLSAYLYFRNPDGTWVKSLPTEQLERYKTKNGVVDAIKMLRLIDGIELIVSKKEDQSLEILRDSAKANITKIDKRLLYKNIVGDPLKIGRFSDQPLMPEEWLANTSSADYPYAVPRLWELMNKYNTPDIILTSKEGFDFGKDYESVVGNYKGGHGGLRRSMMNVPFILYQKDGKAEYIKYETSEQFGRRILNLVLN
jgi:hypothetical protein